MAIQNTDLLVLQDPTDSQFYKLKVGDLGSYFEESAVTSIQTQSPINTDNDPESPTISIDEANTTRTGVVARLAQASDVVYTNGSPSATAVVTANLLRSTNDVVNTNTSNISALQPDVVDLLSDVSTLQGDVSSLQTDVSTLQGNVSGLLTDVSTLQTNVSGLQTDVSALQASIDGGTYAS